MLLALCQRKGIMTPVRDEVKCKGFVEWEGCAIVYGLCFLSLRIIILLARVWLGHFLNYPSVAWTEQTTNNKGWQKCEDRKSLYQIEWKITLQMYFCLQKVIICTSKKFFWVQYLFNLVQIAFSFKSFYKKVTKTTTEPSNNYTANKIQYEMRMLARQSCLKPLMTRIMTLWSSFVIW